MENVKSVNIAKDAVPAKRSDYVLDVKVGYMVDFAMLAGKDIVTAEVTFEQAKAMLSGGKVRATKTVEGFPLTADDKYFFPGFLEEKLDLKKVTEGPK